jgi:hypothetical protein
MCVCASCSVENMTVVEVVDGDVTTAKMHVLLSGFFEQKLLW